MSWRQENWLFTVEETDGGDLALTPRLRTVGLQPLQRTSKTSTLLDRWRIDFVLPKGTEHDDARRIADLLNEWVESVSCVSRSEPPEA